MKVVVRSDASVQLGAGHIMRCLALAGELRSEGARVSFICRELPGDLCGLVEKKGYPVRRLPESGRLPEGKPDQDDYSRGDLSPAEDAVRTIAVLEKDGGADWLVVDHYSLDSRWESQMRPLVKNIMVIDDLADRPHDCDLLLDQNLCKDMETRYQGLVPAHCRKLLGPGHALLRPEFRAARKILRERDGRVRRILVFFGGSDPADQTSKALEAIRRLNRPDISVDVVVGDSNPARDRVREKCSRLPNTAYHCQVENMAGLMAAADLAIGAGGTAAWERCFLGLPAVVLVVAQNQDQAAAAVAAAGAVRNLGWHDKVGAESLADAVEELLRNPGALREMGEKAVKLMGNGRFCVDLLRKPAP